MAKRPMPVLPGIFRVAFNWSIGAERATNVFHVSSSAATSAALYSVLNTNVTTAMWSHVIVPARITNVQIYNLGDLSSVFETTPVGTNWGGAVASGPFMLAPAVVVSLNTDKRGPSNRGRLYLPWVAEAVGDNGSLDSATTTALQNAWDAFRLALPSGGTALHVTSYGHRDAEGEFLPGKEAHSSPVLSTQVHQTLGTVRPRQGRHYV